MSLKLNIKKKKIEMMIRRKEKLIGNYISNFFSQYAVVNIAFKMLKRNEMLAKYSLYLS